MPVAPKRVRFRFIFYLALFLLAFIGGTIGFMLLEGMEPIQSLYFVIVTIATVGYGDLSPQTSPGKILAIIIIIMGVGSFLSMIGNAAELFLTKREHESRMEKLNMVIGLFFSEVGTSLLTLCSDADPQRDKISNILPHRNNWNTKKYQQVRQELKGYEFQLDPDEVNLEEIHQLLKGQRKFLVRLLENPAVMEYEAFTSVLWAVFHLVDEIEAQEDISKLMSFDRAHIIGDTQRVYELLVLQWLRYMQHMYQKYPFLFARAVRRNPFIMSKSTVLKQMEDKNE